MIRTVRIKGTCSVSNHLFSDIISHICCWQSNIYFKNSNFIKDRWNLSVCIKMACLKWAWTSTCFIGLRFKKLIHPMSNHSKTLVKFISHGALRITQQTRHIKPMLFYCWPTVFDAGPTSKQHWINVSCFQDKYHCTLSLKETPDHVPGLIPINLLLFFLFSSVRFVLAWQYNVLPSSEYIVIHHMKIRTK